MALNAISQKARRSPPAFHTLFPQNTSPIAIDLLSKMLAFHPDDRCTVEQALAHPYLKDFHGQMSEPVARTAFDFEFERHYSGDDIPESEVRRLMFEEVCLYRGRGSADSKSGPSGGAGDKDYGEKKSSGYSHK